MTSSAFPSIPTSEVRVPFRQGKIVPRVWFGFGKNDFSYSRREQGTTQTHLIKYLDLESELVGFVERRVELKIFAVLSFFLAAALFSAQHKETLLPPGTAIWLTLGIFATACYTLVCFKYTIVSAGRREIRVLKDKSHDAVLEELFSRRNALLREVYGRIDLDNDLDAELRKHEWLRDEGVISEERLVEIESIIRKSQDPDYEFLDERTIN